MKYIVTTNAAGMTMALMFDSHYRHKDIAAADVISAGVCMIANGKVACCGESKSLGVVSRPATDAAILERMLQS